MRRFLFNSAILFAIILWYCVCINIKATAQNNDFIFRHITTENGLVNNNVKYVFQDSYGYIWIGTQGGLQRYDGYRFVTYVADFHNPDALQSDWINVILEDSKKRFWIGTDKGSVYLLDRGTGKFYNYNLHPTGDKSIIKNVGQICEDRLGDIWLTAATGVFKLNNSTNQFENFNTVFSLTDQMYVSSIGADRQGNIWLSTTAGLKFYDVVKHTVSDKNNNPLKLPVFDIKEGIACTCFDTNDNLWVSTGYNHFLYRYNFKTKILKPYAFDEGINKGPAAAARKAVISTLYETKGGKMYVGLIPRGIAVYDNAADTFNTIDANNENPYGIHREAGLFSSLSIFDDKERNIWIGTDKGINIYSPGKQVFFNYGAISTGDDKKNSAALPINFFLQTPDGDIYVPYYYPNGGINRYDSNLVFKRHYLFTGEKAAEGKNEIWYLYSDEKGIIWAPNQEKTILKLNPQTGEFKNTENAGLAGNINIIKQDAAGSAWVGHWSKGLIKVDGATGQTTAFNNNGRIKNVGSLLFDKDNKIWVGCRNEGLWLFDKEKKSFITQYTASQQNNTSISNNNISDIVAYNDDTLIIATLAGINIFDKRRGTFSVISSNDGLPDNLIVSVALDRQKNLWVCCASGICKVDIYTHAVTRYDITDGVLQTEFTGVLLPIKNGRILVAGSRGFMAFNPGSIAKTKPPPDVSITGFWVFDKKMNIDSASAEGKGLHLHYSDNSIRIEFSALQFTSPDKIKYYYQLEGVDKNWVPASREQVANYNQLRNGDYVFKVRAANREGVFSAKTTSLSIYIIPPFWKQWWFIAIMVLLAAGLMYWFIKWREQNIRTIEAEKTKVQELTAEQYKNQLELEQISNFFSTSLINNSNIDDVLWDVAKKLIGKLGFVDCMIYLWNDDKTKLVQKAGYGPKGSFEEIQKLPFDVVPGQGVVGYVAQKNEAVIIPDTSVDPRYRADEMIRLSEICVPIKYNEELLGIIDSEHYDKHFFTNRHLQILSTIAALIAGKIKSIEAASALRQRKEELDNVQHQLAQVQLSALRSQMNPHFIFNSLNSINTFILQNDQDNASEYLNKFSQLMRMILDNSRSEWVLLENELKALELYIQLEVLRFDNVFTYEIRVSDDVYAAGVVVPPLIIQPYVENAIWHGLMHRREPGGKIAITVTRANNALLIQVEDNGVGREIAALKRKKNVLHKSHGMKITAERLAVVNDVYKVNAGVTLTDLKDAAGATNGTSVLLTIQYKRNESNID